MKYVYISGPVTGRPYEEARAEFDAAAEAIRKKHGCEVVVVNPMDFCQQGEEWGLAMRKCLNKLLQCDYIHMLPGWEHSKGAKLELQVAAGLGFGVCNEEQELVDYEA